MNNTAGAKSVEDIKLKAQQELATRELARRDLLKFTELVTPNYKPGWIHRVICDELMDFYDEVNKENSPRLAIFVPPRHGKEVSHHTPVLTTGGWKTHGELAVGDYVFHPSGRPVRVTALSQEYDSEFVVTFSNGEQVECHGNHEWTVYDRIANRYLTLETREMFDGVPVRAGGKRGVVSEGTPGKRGVRYSFQLPVTQPLQMAQKTYDLHPYVLGVWLGDGTSTRGTITYDVGDTEHLDYIRELGYETGAPWAHTDSVKYPRNRHCTIYGLTTHLRALGVFDNKHIPNEYLLGSVEQRLALLAGLVDTDGYVDKNGRGVFSSINKRLADDVFGLAASLGFRPTQHVEPKRTSTSGIEGRHDIHKVYFSPNEGCVPPTKLPRKCWVKFPMLRKVSITDISPLGVKSTGRCIEVDSEDGLYLVGRNLVATHNSVLSSINFPAWALGHNPRSEIVVASYAANLSDEFSKKSREILRDPRYQKIFPGTNLHKDMASVDNWKTTALGGYVSVGVGGGLTGKGANILILDDLYPDRKTAESATYRKSVIDWYTSTAYTRLMPGGGVLVLFTRWHEDDLGGYIETLEGENFKILRYPAIAEDDEEFRLAGEPLHPERYDVKALNRIKYTLGSRDWNSLYQQNPTPAEGDLFKLSSFRFYTDAPEPEDMAVMVTWDLSTGKSMDYSAGIVVGVDRKQDLYVLDVIRKRMTSLELAQTIIDTHTKWHAQFSGLEVGQISSTIEPILEKLMNEQKKFIRLIKLKPGRANKVGRSMNIVARMEQGKVLFDKSAHWYADFEAELLKFPNGRNDDMVDAFAYAGYAINEIQPPKEKTKPKKKSWKDNIHKYLKKSGGGKSHMSA